MGAVCCGFNNTEEPKSITITSLDERQRKGNKVSYSKPGTLEIETTESKRNIFELISKEELEAGFNQGEEIIAKPGINQTPNLLIDENLKIIPNALKFWAHLDDLPNGCKLHHYYSKLALPFTPEFITAFSLNLTQAQVKKMDDSIDYFELIDYSVNENTIIAVTKTVTKKILVVSPKSFLVFRALRKLDNGNFVEFQKSVELTGLVNDSHFKHLVDDLKNAGEIHFGAESTEFTNGESLRQTFTKVDVKSGVGMALLKSMLKTRIKTYNENLIKQMTEFLVKTEDYSSLIWFDVDKAEKLKQIFQTNLMLLKNSKLNFGLLDQALVCSLNEKTTKPKEDELDESDVGDRIEETKEENIETNGLESQIEKQTEPAEQTFEEDTKNILGESAEKEPVDTQETPVSLPKDIQMDSVNSQSDESSQAKPINGNSEVTIEPLRSHLHDEVKPAHMTTANNGKKKRKNRKN